MAIPGAIFAQTEGMAGSASGYDAASQSQAAIMADLGSTFDVLGGSLQGQAGMAAQAAGANLHAHSQRAVQLSAGQSEKMNNNLALHVNNDEQHSHILGQVAALT